MLRCGGLDERDLRRHRLERDELGEVDLAAWSGILLGGGPFNVSDPDGREVAGRSGGSRPSWPRLAERVVAADFPFFGACYGIGVLGRTGGGAVDRTYGEPIGCVEVTLTEAGRADPLFAGCRASFDVLLGHKEAVSTAARGAVRAGVVDRLPGAGVPARRSTSTRPSSTPSSTSRGWCCGSTHTASTATSHQQQAQSVMDMARRSRRDRAATLLAAFVERYARA